jgi:hypothetical protein
MCTHAYTRDYARDAREGRQECVVKSANANGTSAERIKISSFGACLKRVAARSVLLAIVIFCKKEITSVKSNEKKREREREI